MLFLNSVLGRPIKNAKVSFLAPDDGGTNLVEFFSITLANVFISKFSVSAASGDNNTREVVTLNYGMILLHYTPAFGTPIKAGFDVIKNKEIMSLPGIPD